MDFSLWWLLLFQSTGFRAQASVVAARGLSSSSFWALEHRLNSCGTRALLLSSMCNLPGPGIQLISPALVVHTVPPGKPSLICLACCHQATLSSYLSSSALKHICDKIHICVCIHIYMCMCVLTYILYMYLFISSES